MSVTLLLVQHLDSRVSWSCVLANLELLLLSESPYLVGLPLLVEVQLCPCCVCHVCSWWLLSGILLCGVCLLVAI